MPSWIGDPLTTLAFCWRLERRDGIALGFTSHDHDLEIDGLCYRAAPGIAPSAIEYEAGLPAAALDVAGVLTDDAITVSDLEGGRWDGARLHLFAANWSEPSAEVLQLASGSLGRIERSDEAFTAELRGPAERLDAILVPESSPACRATLGDVRCGIDMRGRSRMVTISAVNDAVVTVAGGLVAGLYGAGSLTMLDGASAGLVLAVAASDTTTVTLADLPPLPLLPGQRCLLTEGCDRRFSTCSGRFANTANFRGEPHLPGNDLLLRYAG